MHSQPPHQTRDTEPAPQIFAGFQEHVGQRRVGHLLCQSSIQAMPSRKFKRTIADDHAFNTTENLLWRDFGASRGLQKTAAFAFEIALTISLAARVGLSRE